MKPLTETQKEVLALSKKLKPMDLSKMDTRKLFDGHIIRKRGKCYCSACGEYICDEKDLKTKTNAHDGRYYAWTSYEKLISPKKCPHCHIRLTDFTQSKSVWVAQYAVAEQIKGYYVIRIAWFCSRQRAGQPQEVWTQGENQQYWIKGDKKVRMSQNLTFMAHRHFIPFSSWDQELKMRNTFYPTNNYYKLDSIDQLTVKSRLFRRKYKPLLNEPRNIIDNIAKQECDPYYETLIKMGRKDLYEKITPSEMRRYKHAIRIALKHGNHIDDWSHFRDTLTMMREFKMDTHSPRYLCDPNLHEVLLDRKEHKRLIKEALEREKQYQATYDKGYNGMPIEEYYKQAKGKYLQWDIQTDKYHLFVMPSIYEIMQEGIHMHHCVFAMGYWHKQNSLILACRDLQGNRVATIEVNTRTNEIMQIQGKCDRKPACHDEVKAIINQHIKQICHPRTKRTKKTA